MADTKITALAAIATVDPAADVLPIVDISDTSMAASGTTKKVTSNQILGAGGTATLASATITGDLTVDTSTLKVDSTNNRVIVGHTSGSSAFQVTNAGAAGLEIQPTGFSSAPLILSYNRSGSAYTQLTLDGSTIVHALSGTTAMTLNSTGLGIGGSPSYKLHVAGSNPTAAINSTLASISSIATLLYRNVDGNSATQSVASIAGETAGNGGYGNLIFSTGFNGSLVERMRIDLSGNLILQSSATPATLGTNGMLTVNATSNTNLRFSYRGSDGTTRVANLTLA